MLSLGHTELKPVHVLTNVEAIQHRRFVEPHTLGTSLPTDGGSADGC